MKTFSVSCRIDGLRAENHIEAAQAFLETLAGNDWKRGLTLSVKRESSATVEGVRLSGKEVKDALTIHKARIIYHD